MILRLLAFILLSGFVGCQSESSSPPSSDVQSILDDTGRTVELPATINRIVPIAPNITEILYSAGAGHLVVGVSNADDFPSEIESVSRFSSFPMDYEALVALRPDVIIASDEINNPRDADQMTELGLNVIYFSFDDWTDVPRVMLEIGEIAGVADKAKAAADSLNREMERIAASSAGNEDQPELLFLIGSDQLFAYGAGNYIHNIVNRAGAVSLTAEMETRAPILSEEFVLSASPDIIAGTFSEPGALLEHHPVFADMPAFANNHVCAVESSLLLRAGPRLVAGARALSECIERYKDRVQ